MAQLHFQLALTGLLSPLDATAGVVMPLLRAAQISNPLRRIKSQIPKPDRTGNLAAPGVTLTQHTSCSQPVGALACRFASFLGASL